MKLIHQCPKCEHTLDEMFRCLNCSISYPFQKIDNTLLIDFISPIFKNGCPCPQSQHQTQGIAPCQVRCALDLKTINVSKEQEPVDYKAKILKPVMALNNQVILDVGCGACPIGRVLALKNTLIGVDLCPQGILKNKQNAMNKQYSELLIADSLNLPFSKNQVDWVIVTDMLEHLLFPEKALNEFHRVLKPGGKVLAAVPNLVSYQNRLTILLGFGVGIKLHNLLQGKSLRHPINGLRYPDQKAHLRFMTISSLSVLFQSLGFRIQSTFGYDPVLSRLPWADRIFKNTCILAGVIAEKQK